MKSSRCGNNNKFPSRAHGLRTWRQSELLDAPQSTSSSGSKAPVRNRSRHALHCWQCTSFSSPEVSRRNIVLPLNIPLNILPRLLQEQRCETRQTLLDSSPASITDEYHDIAENTSCSLFDEPRRPIYRLRLLLF